MFVLGALGSYLIELVLLSTHNLCLTCVLGVLGSCLIGMIGTVLFEYQQCMAVIVAMESRPIDLLV